METYIILLRAVMPTGKNKVPMAQLRVTLEKAGLKNVRTYIQGGNAIVKSSMKASDIEKLVHQVIKNDIGVDIIVVARIATQFGKIVENNPFFGEDTFFSCRQKKRIQVAYAVSFVCGSASVGLDDLAVPIGAGVLLAF